MAREASPRSQLAGIDLFGAWKWQQKAARRCGPVHKLNALCYFSAPLLPNTRVHQVKMGTATPATTFFSLSVTLPAR